MGVEPALANAIGRLAQMRSDSAALRRGSYTQLHVAAEQLGFIRELDGETVVVLLNASDQPVELAVPAPRPGEWRDLLNGDTGRRLGRRAAGADPASWGGCSQRASPASDLDGRHQRRHLAGHVVPHTNRSS